MDLKFKIFYFYHRHSHIFIVIYYESRQRIHSTKIPENAKKRLVIWLNRALKFTLAPENGFQVKFTKHTEREYIGIKIHLKLLVIVQFIRACDPLPMYHGSYKIALNYRLCYSLYNIVYFHVRVTIVAYSINLSQLFLQWLIDVKFLKKYFLHIVIPTVLHSAYHGDSFIVAKVRLPLGSWPPDPWDKERKSLEKITLDSNGESSGNICIKLSNGSVE